MVEPVVARDLLGERGQLVTRFLFGQRLDRARVERLAVLPGCGRSAHARPPAIRLAAAARASAVTMRPDSMRAISSCLVSGSSSSTRVTVWYSERPLATRQWWAPRVATCGEWHTTRTCTLEPRRRNA